MTSGNSAIAKFFLTRSHESSRCPATRIVDRPASLSRSFNLLSIGDNGNYRNTGRKIEKREEVGDPITERIGDKFPGLVVDERELVYRVYTECVQRTSWYPQIRYIRYTTLESFDVSPVERWNHPHYRTSCYEQQCRRRFIPTLNAASVQFRNASPTDEFQRIFTGGFVVCIVRRLRREYSFALCYLFPESSTIGHP